MAWNNEHDMKWNDLTKKVHKVLEIPNEENKILAQEAYKAYNDYVDNMKQDSQRENTFPRSPKLRKTLNTITLHLIGIYE
jgi:hypothetical protein